MVWNKYSTIRRWFHNRVWSRNLAVRGDNSFCRSRGNHRHHSGHRFLLYYYIAFSVLPVAAEPKVHNTSNPVAAATGNVTNQAVQIQNSGAASRQYFAANSSCNGPTMSFTPFVMGANTSPYEPESRTTTANWGLQLNFAVPLDGGMIETCKEIARRHEDKMRLDYELTRALKCSEIMRNGFMLRPNTRVYHMCSDVIPIVANGP